MEELLKSGCTVFFVSHSMSSVTEICSRAILLDKGELILQGSPKLVTMNYLKLLYANTGDQNEIRKEILQLDKNEQEKKKFDSTLGAHDFTLSDREEPVPFLETQDREPGQESFYIPDFKPKSTVIIKNEEVGIYDLHIKTLDGKEVNALVMNEEYIYSYKVEFGNSIKNVNFGMGIKNEKGLALSWMIYPGINRFMEKEFVKGERYSVSWHFKCLFTPGNYYIDSGLRSMKEDKLIILVKITDALAFKVQDIEFKQKGGFFNPFRHVEVTPHGRAAGYHDD